MAYVLRYNNQMTDHPDLTLKDFLYNELQTPEGLARLDQAFLMTLEQENRDWHSDLLHYREMPDVKMTPEISALLINCATVLESFLADLFNISEAVHAAQLKTTSFNPLSTFKKYFILRRAKKETSKLDKLPPFPILNDWLNDKLNKSPIKTTDKELAVALFGNALLDNADENKTEIDQLVFWCAHMLGDAALRASISSWKSFALPTRIDHQQLIEVSNVQTESHECVTAPQDRLRHRDGFALTDPRMSAREVQDEVNYCIYCHDHEGDFCSRGFPVKKGDPAQGFKKNPLDITLTGCPLEEKISEMNFLKRDGYTLGSLAMVMIDNPMCPATGHRICNDCMKACIYQKQDPVNIPQIETRVLTDALDLPWGVEIYDLLTRWNPLRHRQWTSKPYNGLKVMIAGMGPAGFTLAHHLLVEGFAVVGFDGLKIEPLAEELIKKPIYRFDDLKESLDERIMAGFGGVAEYGITVRWDKNFLKLIYLSLMRRPHFQVFGGVRFGGTITIDDAWEMGFDHFAVAVGAGLPKALPIPGSMAPGMRQANDFLMALQLGNAAKQSSLTNLQLRLPAVIVGGGLTGVDTATEAQAYYISQIEKIKRRYEVLSSELGEEAIHQQLDRASREILAEYLRHANEVQKERQRAKAENRAPDFIRLIHEWGGVTIAYRRSMQESPAYVNNHEELQKALEEGIFYAEGLEPASVDLNEFGHAEALVCRKRMRNQDNEWVTTNEEVRLPARSILVATGTQPNTAYEFEYKGTFNRVNLQYQHHEDINGELTVAHGVEHCKDPLFGPFTSYQKQDHRVSLIGDTHPVFHGNVVKAIASGMRTYPKILALLHNKLGKAGSEEEYKAFANNMDYLFRARINNIVRRTNKTLELTIQAPLVAKHFKPGQFCRLQNFETLAAHIDHTMLQMEPLILKTVEHDPHHGTLTFSVHETSAAAKLCATLKKDEAVSLMGPAGVRAKIPAVHESILIIGDEQSFAFVRCYGKALKAAGNHVLYICLLNNKDELYCQPQLEEVCDEIIWVCADDIKPNRSQDIATHPASLPELLTQYESGTLGNNKQMTLADIDRVYLIGTTNLLKTYQSARKTTLKSLLLKDPATIGSVYGNMQCMLKGVCAQCLQWQIDPETGQRTKAVFACSWQDQPLELIDIAHLDERKMQNQLHDHLSNLWVDHLFKQHAISRI